MGEQQSIRDEIIATIYATPTPAGIQSEWPFPVTVTELADGLLASPVIRHIQAESLREAAMSGAFGTGAQATLLARADRIEKGDIS